MARSLAKALLIVLAVAPLAAIVCGLSCAASPQHHGYGSEQAGNRLTAVHECGSLQADPFVLSSVKIENAPESLSVSLPPVLKRLAFAPIGGVWLGQLDFGPPLPPHPQPSVLRI